jgi:long-chain acyl-CoA synthetase
MVVTTKTRPWLAHYDAGVPHHIEYPDITLPEMLKQSATAYPRRVATRFFDATLTYGHLSKLVERLAGALHELGVRRGDRVAVMLPNLPQFPIAFYAILRLGAIAVPTNPLYKHHELTYQLNDAGAETLIVLDRLYATARRALPATNVRNVICTGVQDFLPPAKALLYPIKSRHDGTPLPRLKGAAVLQMRHLLRHAPWKEPTPSTPEDIAVLQYTGGTTGISKGAMLTHRNLVVNAVQTWYCKRPASDSVESTLCVTPFFHVYGLTVGMNSSIYGGLTMLLLPRFIPADVLSVIRKYRPTRFPGVPTMYLALANHPGITPDDCASLKICISGSAPLPPEVQESFKRSAGGEVVEGYGLTEASPVTHSNPLDRFKSGTVGVPYPDTDAAIVDRVTGESLPPGQPGELIVRGPQVMRGYWNRPEETAQVLKDGWLFTGDIATMDTEGYFTILDRAKDIIIAGGYNIYPREVEDVLFTHPAVAEAAVCGVPDAYRGETVKAFIVLKDGARAGEEEIITYCRERLATFKAPRQVEFRDSLPKTAVGKVLRRELAGSWEPAVKTAG